MSDAATDVQTLRAEADRLIAAGDATAAARALRRLWSSAPGAATASFLVGRIEQLRSGLSLKPFRLYVLRSFTVEPAVPVLRAMAFTHGIDLDVRLGAFNAFAQEILDADSELYSSSPDAVVFAVQTRDIAPALWDGFADLDGAGAAAAVSGTRTLLGDLVRTLNGRTNAQVILHNLEVPSTASQGILDSQREPGQVEAVRRVNRGLASLARRSTGVWILDYDGLVARHGRGEWFDGRKWLTARMPVSAPHVTHLAAEWLRYLAPIAGRVCKAVAVDLDNTLWGGVIGEDGLDGIKLDGEYPGAAYQDVQRALLDLHRRGVMLAVCSKNNPDEALEALEGHPGMILRPKHFSSVRINWQDKAQNLREIAAELNIGIDAMAFLDDNPVEREFVRAALPEVTVIDLPEAPMAFAGALRSSPVFERLTLTEEDRARGRYYAEQRERTRSEESATSLDDFLRSLDTKVSIDPVDARTLPRAAQLTQKTNQFNLTTRRYGEPEVESFVRAPEMRLYTTRVSDRFGDSGVVGLVILRLEQDVCEIDTFLLSCRVIGRGVETALLAACAEEARRSGAKRLLGRYVETSKNAPAREFFPSHGFTSLGSGEWELDLEGQPLESPDWIAVENATRGEASYA